METAVAPQDTEHREIEISSLPYIPGLTTENRNRLAVHFAAGDHVEINVGTLVHLPESKHLRTVESFEDIQRLLAEFEFKHRLIVVQLNNAVQQGPLGSIVI